MFNQVLTFNPWEGKSYCYTAACHGAELPFVFNSFSDGVNGLSFNPSAEEKTLAYGMNNAWSNFVRSGNPNADTPKTPTGPFPFPLYDKDVNAIAMLDASPASSSVEANYRKSNCDFWNTIDYDRLW